MMGGPIDTRRNPTAVNRLATSKPLRVVRDQPDPPGAARATRGTAAGSTRASCSTRGFIAMNPVRHVNVALGLLSGPGRAATPSDAEEHRRFYDEYNAVLDMPAEYYLDCVRIVFQEHLLPRGTWHVGGERVAPAGDHRHRAADHRRRARRHLRRSARPERRTSCAPASRPSAKHHLTVEGAGHYGIFSGRRWREIVYPQVRDFIASTTTDA